MDQQNPLVPYNGTPIVRWLVLQRICPNRKIASSPHIMSKVRINAAPVESLSQLVQETDTVEYDGQVITVRVEGHVHYIMNKPPGCLSSRRNMHQLKGGIIIADPRPSVYDYIPPDDRPHVNSIGRLDYDTTGLLLFTSDGMLQHALATPKFKVDKIYSCTLRTPGPLSDEAIAQLQEGVQLPHAKGAIVRGKAWNVPNTTHHHHNSDDSKNSSVVDLCIQGGYTHQVKLMLRLVNRPLRLLHRRTFANLELPQDLESGECRLMMLEEIDHLYRLAKQQMEVEREEEGTVDGEL